MRRYLPDKLSVILTLAYVFGALIIILYGAYGASADTIKPTCWEDKVNGEVHRHCEVNRPEAHAPAASPAPAPIARPLYDDGSAVPPPQAYGRPPNYRWYAGPQSVQPNFGPGYRGPPGAPYYGVPQPPPFYPPPYYYAPPAYYYPPPIVFGFGPFSVVIP